MCFVSEGPPHHPAQNDSSVKSCDLHSIEPKVTGQTSDVIEAIHQPAPTTAIQPIASLSDTVQNLKPTTGEEVPQRVEVAGWTDVGSLSTSLAIRKVSDFVKSIKDVSHSLSSSPPISSNDSMCSANKSHNMICGRSINISDSMKNTTLRSHVKPNSMLKETLTASATEDISTIAHSSSSAKEKPYNFASSDAGARLLAASAGTIGAKNVLENNDDKYLLTPCGSSGLSQSLSRWIDVELSEEMILERFQTGNLEYYSSSPKKVVILGASSYPPNQWKLLGMFQFANIRSLQLFQVQRRVVTRYLRVLFLGRQGHEFYCPISIVRVFGKNLIADWKDALEQKAPNPFSTKLPITKTIGEDDRRALDSNFIVKRTNGENESKSATVLKADISDKITNLGADIGLHKDENSDLKEGVVSDSFKYDSSYMNKNKHVGDTVGSRKDLSVNDLKLQEGEMGNQYNGKSSSSSEEHIMSEDDQIVIEAVHGDTLKTATENDNIFRKVTRMLKLLELNQTLTNQYIDTQLAKFVKTIQALHEKLDEIERQVPRLLSLEQEVLELSKKVEEAFRLRWQRDILFVTLILVFGFIAGVSMTSWINRNGRQGQFNAERLLGGKISPDHFAAQEKTSISLKRSKRSISSSELSRNTTI